MHSSLRLVPLLALSLAACGGGDGGGEQQPDAAPATPAPAAQAPTAAAPAASGDTITIRMLTTQSGASGQFEPATVTAKPGDVLHFVGDGGAAHNVAWPAADNPGKTGLPATSPYVTAPEQAIDVPVTMGAGTYQFNCEPHAPMGMKGTLTVSG